MVVVVVGALVQVHKLHVRVVAVAVLIFITKRVHVMYLTTRLLLRAAVHLTVQLTLGVLRYISRKLILVINRREYNEK